MNLFAGTTTLCAEGYVFELERRGYLKAGAYVPEAVTDNPQVVWQLHHEFIRAGTDVVLALTYYAHREKLRVIGREGELEQMNRRALRIARAQARDGGLLMAGNICNTWAYDPDGLSTSYREVYRQYTEQVRWAKEEGADFIIAETIEYLGEAKIALEVIKRSGLPAVINFTPIYDKTRDGFGWVEACRVLKHEGADVVGFNCGRGPGTMMPLLRKLRAQVDGPIAGVPVPYRTTSQAPAFQLLRDETGYPSFPTELDGHACTRDQMAAFAFTAREEGVDFIGACCGAGPHHIRAMAEALGRTTAASKNSPDMSQHALLGNGARESERVLMDEYLARGQSA